VEPRFRRVRSFFPVAASQRATVSPPSVTRRPPSGLNWTRKEAASRSHRTSWGFGPASAAGGFAGPVRATSNSKGAPLRNPFVVIGALLGVSAITTRARRELVGGTLAVSAFRG